MNQPATRDDERWMAAAIALGARGQGTTAPNPSIGCIIVHGDRVVGRGATGAGGRPHAEAVAIAQAGAAAAGATAYVSLEPCAHVSTRGPACADLLIAAGVGRVVAGLIDPDPRTRGQGLARLAAAGIAVTHGVQAALAAAAIGGFVARIERGRPHITLKLAMSLDGVIALGSGESRWITGDVARAHGHAERARSDMIVVGGGTLRADSPRLDVRLAGLEARSPRRAVLTSGSVPPGWTQLVSPQAVFALGDTDWVLVEGGAGAAAAFLRAGLVDRLLLYRAPIIIGGGKPCVGDIGLTDLAAAHGRWQLTDARTLGSDRLEVYQAVAA